MGDDWEGEMFTGPVMTVAALDVHVPIKSSCVAANAVLSSVAAPKSNALRRTISNAVAACNLDPRGSSLATEAQYKQTEN